MEPVPNRNTNRAVPSLEQIRSAIIGIRSEAGKRNVTGEKEEPGFTEHNNHWVNHLGNLPFDQRKAIDAEGDAAFKDAMNKHRK